MIPFLKTRREKESPSTFGIGTILKVEKKPLVVDDGKSTTKKTSTENITETTDIYTVLLESSSGIIENVQSGGAGENGYADITSYPVGTRVLLGFFRNFESPYILKALPISSTDARRGTRGDGIEYPAIEPGEYYRSSSGKSSIYQRNDGAVVVRGARRESEDEGYRCSSYVVVGGNCGINQETKKPNMIIIGLEQLGPIISIDENGDLIFSSGIIKQLADQVEERIITSKVEKIGKYVNDKEKRYGVKDVTIGEDKIEKIGKSNTKIVGDINEEDSNGNTLDPYGEHKIHSGQNMNLFARQKINIDTKRIDKDGNEISILATDGEAPRIYIGDEKICKDKPQPIVLGQQFKTAFDTFLQNLLNCSSYIGTGNHGAPVPMSPGFINSIKILQGKLQKLLSKKTFVELDREEIK